MTLGAGHGIAFAYDRPIDREAFETTFKDYLSNKNVLKITEFARFITYVVVSVDKWPNLDNAKDTKKMGLPMVAIQWSAVNVWTREKGFTTAKGQPVTIEKVGPPTTGKDVRYGLYWHAGVVNMKYPGLDALVEVVGKNDP